MDEADLKNAHRVEYMDKHGSSRIGIIADGVIKKVRRKNVRKRTVETVLAITVLKFGTQIKVMKKGEVVMGHGWKEFGENAVTKIKRKWRWGMYVKERVPITKIAKILTRKKPRRST